MSENLRFMLLALENSHLALPLCRPNPPVGCVIVHNGEVVSTGFTRSPGHHHAEDALDSFQIFQNATISSSDNTLSRGLLLMAAGHLVERLRRERRNIHIALELTSV